MWTTPALTACSANKVVFWVVFPGSHFLKEHSRSNAATSNASTPCTPPLKPTDICPQSIDLGPRKGMGTPFRFMNWIETPRNSRPASARVAGAPLSGVLELASLRGAVKPACSNLGLQ
ncbi:hypothetical protein IG631_02917 [Alternaria alternata]|nr:hypothetical protein IG631_02917 [Alternaria alternata]